MQVVVSIAVMLALKKLYGPFVMDGWVEWVTIFIVFIQVGVSVAIMQVVLSAVHNCFSCKMQVTVSVIAM